MKTRLLCALLALMLCAPALAEGRSREVTIVPEESARLYSALPLAGLKIGIDPGHQAHTDTSKEPVAPGSTETKARVASGTRGVSTGVPEYVRVLEISLLLRDELVRLGAEVLMTRETHDVNISNVERALMMNEWGADAVVRVHLNGSTNKNAHGIGMYVRATGACAEESAYLARCLLSALKSVTGAHIQSVYKRDTYTGLNWSEVPCVLAELGYMTNPEEDENTARPEYQLLLAQGVAQGICQYFETITENE